MKTINTTLPVYDRLGKQIYQQVLANNLDKMCPTITPRHRLPSMQWNVTGDNPGEITDIDLIDLLGNTTAIEDYFFTGAGYLYDAVNDNYDTFIRGGFPPNRIITSCVKTVAGGEERALCISSFSLSVYNASYITANSTKSYRFDWTLTLNSGTAPKVALRDTATSLITKSNIVTLVNGRNVFYLTPNEDTGNNLAPVIYNSDTELSNFALDFGSTRKSGYLTNHPRLVTDGTDTFFQYNGNALGTLLTAGTYYLKFTSGNGYVYYSDWFLVDCVYENLITTWSNYSAHAYETLSVTGTRINSAIETGASGNMLSGTFNVIKGEKIKVILLLTLNSGQLPTLYIVNNDWSLNDSQVLVAGLNDVELITTWEGVASLRITNSAASNFTTSEVLVIREYSEKYIKIDFSNTCDIGDIYYEGGFEQTLWLESETLEPTFPYVEKGVENGLGRFVTAYQRQDKIWLMRTKLIPQYIVDVLHRLKLHDDVDLIDTVGNEYAVKHVDVEHDWQFDDKYYAMAQISLDFDEYGLVTGCCS